MEQPVVISRIGCVVVITRIGYADSVKVFSEGRRRDDAVAILNKAVDLILQSKNDLREVRFDFNKPRPHKSPPVHVIEDKQVEHKKIETPNDSVYQRDVPHR